MTGRILRPNESVAGSHIAGTNVGVQKHSNLVQAGGGEWVGEPMEEIPLACGVEDAESCESCQ